MKSTALTCASISLVCFFIQGCSTVVYKDSATQYVAASKDLVKFLSDSDSAFKSSSNLAKTAIIESDANCPIAQDRLFVRDQNPPKFSVYIDSAQFQHRIDSIDPIDRPKLKRSCAALRSSENDLRSRNTCYSEQEAGCLFALEQDMRVDPLNKDVEPAFSEAMATIEYDKSPSGSQLLGRTLLVITSYMDALGKLADGQTADINETAKDINKKITDLQAEYAKYSGKDVPKNDATTLKAVSGKITALGAVLEDVNNMVSAEKEISKMKSLVEENKTKVDTAIAELAPDADAMVLMNATLLDAATMKIRDEMQRQFKSSADSYSRRKIWDEMKEKYPYSNPDTKALLSGIDKLFTALKQSHQNLVSLMEKPSDEQRAKLRAADLASFRSLVEDTLSAAAAFK